MRKLYGLLTALLFFCSFSAFAQSKEVSGKVTDSKDGTVLPGVTIQLKGTSKTTFSASDGSFKITVTGSNPVLIFTSVGFVSKEIAVKNETTVTVSLTAADKVIEEVVVTGYTSQIKKQSTASIVKVNADEVKSQPIGSFEQLLQGKAPGILIQSQSGQPGSAANVTIRGKGSVLGTTEPLYIVDGIQVTAQDFQSINPSDFDSYNILKDAVATSQYGSRGANGVIVVTTKRGGNRKTQINYDYQFGISQLPTNKLKLLNSAEKIDYELNHTNAYDFPNFFEWTPEQADSLSKVNANWEEAMFRKAHTQQHQLSASGGNDKTRFFISGSIFDQEGVVISTGLKRYSGRINLDHTLSNSFKLGINTYIGFSKFTNTNENDQFIGSPLNAIRWANPYVTPYNPDGTYNNTDFILQGQPNALRELLENPGLNKQTKGIVTASLEYKSKFIKGLSARTNWGVDYTEDENSKYIDKSTYLGSQQIGGNGSYTQGISKNRRVTGTTSVTYARLFNEHNLRVSLFTELIKNKFNSFGYSGYGLTGAFKNGSGITPGTPTNNYIPTNNSFESENAILSYFAIADYNFRNKYFLTGNFRRDGSSRLAKENKWTNFGGVGASWVISSENFMSNIKFLSDLKLKASYGVAANQGVGDSYEALEQFGPTSYNSIGGLILTNLKKNGLTWERRRTFNAGVEFGLFKNRVSGSVEVYNANTVGLYLNRQISGTNGVSSILTNLGQLRNQGIEVALSFEVLRAKDFEWTFDANYTFNQSKVVKLDGTNENISGVAINRIGERANSAFLVKRVRVDSDNGDEIYLKLDGKTETNQYDPNDKVIAGTYDPPHFGGFTNTFKYKGVELTTLFTYMFGHVIYNNDRANVENPIYAVSNLSKEILTQWEKPGDKTNIPSPFVNFEPNTTRFLEKGDFLRLRNIMLSYSLQKDLLNKIKLSSLRIFVQGQNLVVWHNFLGYDPEVATGVLGGSQYPALKAVTVGVNVGF